MRESWSMGISLAFKQNEKQIVKIIGVLTLILREERQFKSFEGFIYIVLRRRDGNKWEIRTNEELETLFVNLDIITDIKRNKIGLVGHVQPMMDNSRAVRKVFSGTSGG